MRKYTYSPDGTRISAVGNGHVATCQSCLDRIRENAQLKSDSALLTEELLKELAKYSINSDPESFKRAGEITRLLSAIEQRLSQHHFATQAPVGEPPEGMTLYCSKCGTELKGKEPCPECLANFKKAEGEAWTSVAVKVNIQQHMKLRILLNECKQLREDRERLMGALEETTKYLGTSAELIIGTLKHKNNELLSKIRERL